MAQGKSLTEISLVGDALRSGKCLQHRVADAVELRHSYGRQCRQVTRYTGDLDNGVGLRVVTRHAIVQNDERASRPRSMNQQQAYLHQSSGRRCDPCCRDAMPNHPARSNRGLSPIIGFRYLPAEGEEFAETPGCGVLTGDRQVTS